MVPWSQSTRISSTCWIWPLVAPLRQSSRRERDQYQASLASMVLFKASAFIHATMRTAPISTSVFNADRSPLALNTVAKTEPSSISALEHVARMMPLPVTRPPARVR